MPATEKRVTNSISKILVAVRPEDKGLPLPAEQARILAEALGAELILFSALPEAEPAFSFGGRAASKGAVLDAERRELERVAVLLRDWGVSVSVEVGCGMPAYEVILEAVAALEADLVVIGPHRLQLSFPVELTHTDRQLMKLCPCPLFLAKDPNFQGDGTILAAVDPLHRHEEPEGTNRAVLAAAALFAQALRSELRIVHAYPDPAQYSWVSAVEPRPGIFYGSENIEAVHREAVHALAREAGIDEEHVDLVPGEPRLVIPEVVDQRGAHLLVIGVLKRGELEELMLGSTAQSVARDVACNVLMIKPDWPARHPEHR
jgi:universal stress protein E